MDATKVPAAGSAVALRTEELPSRCVILCDDRTKGLRPSQEVEPATMPAFDHGRYLCGGIAHLREDLSRVLAPIEAAVVFSPPVPA
jgi:hypothetical protein